MLNLIHALQFVEMRRCLVIITTVNGGSVLLFEYVGDGGAPFTVNPNLLPEIGIGIACSGKGKWNWN